MEIGVVGATGLVGEAVVHEIINHIGQPYHLHLFSSKTTEATYTQQKVLVQEHPISTLTEIPLNYILFTTPPDVSRYWIQKLKSKKSVFCIDGSSAFRLEKDVPLVIPEINAQAINSTISLVSSPNCTTTLALMPLFPLHQRYDLESFSLCSYQAASGMGRQGIEELEHQCKVWNCNHSVPNPVVFPKKLLFNVIPQVGNFDEDGNTEEETKLQYESRKILNLPTLKVFSTCVRVPTLTCHSLAITVTFKQTITLDGIRDILSHAPGIKVYTKNYPDVYCATTNSLCHVGRLRLDTTHSNTLSLWVVGNQILKGSATNMRQILEMKLQKLNQQ